MTITLHDRELVLAVKSLIAQASQTITSGVVHQGQPRELKTITTSKLTPPMEFYFVAIDAPDASTVTEDGFNYIQYDVEIRVGDYAIMQPGEENLYETMHNDFRLVCNRIVSAITAGRFITANDGTKFTISDTPDIQKVGQSGITPIDNSIHAMLAALIRLEVREICL